MLNNKKIIISLIFFLFLCIRLYKLTTIPYGFHRDEAYTGYNAFSILKTGRDEWGQKFPIFSRSFGDYPPALVLYFTVPFVFLFGLTEFGVRFSTVFFSLINFFLIFKILQNLKIKNGLIYTTLILIATSLWELTQVRGANGDLILGILFFLAGINYLINFYKTKKILNFIIFCLFWSLTYFSYNSFRLQIPLLLPAVLLLIPAINTKIKKYMIIFMTALLFFIPFSFTFLFPQSSIRAQQTFFLGENLKSSLQVLSERSGLMQAPLWITRVFHNKLSYGLFSFTKNFIRMLSFDFLYLFEAVPRRFSVPENGLFLYITFPFLILGIIYFFSSKINKKIKFAFIYLIFTGFLPSVITSDDFPNSKRCFLALYPLIFLIAYGIYNLYRQIKLRQLYLTIIIFGLIINFAYFWYFYQFQSPFLVSHSRNYFYKQIAEVIKDNDNKYNRFKIYTFSEAPHILILFFTKYDPLKYQSYIKTGINPDLFANKTEWGFDKYLFTPEECPIPLKNELIFADISKCKLLSEKVKNNEWEIKGYALSPYGSKEFVYYQLKEI